MSRMDREVEIYASRDTGRDQHEGQWYAEVEGRGHEIIYTTTWHDTVEGAMDDAEAWARENGKVLMPF